MRVFAHLNDLKAHIGQELVVSDWVTIDQDRIDAFAHATGDHQWIHVDPERAAEGPFGATIAHGFLTLSLLPLFLDQCLRIEKLAMSINYGLNKVRFTSPVPVGSRIRVRLSLIACDPIESGGQQIEMQVVFEREGSDKPVCIANSLTRRYPQPD
jgi:acyl dehydratase